MSRRLHALLEVPGSIECRIIGRVNRFVVKVDLSGSEALAYLQNTGRLRDYLKPDRIGFCAPLKKARKLRYRLLAVKDDGFSALIDTLLQARGFEKAVERGLIPWLRGYRIERREVSVGRVRLDYLARRGSDRAFIELKSGVLRIDDYAAYPDCPSKRARDQLKAMMRLARRGERVFLVFVAAIPRVRGFRLNPEADPSLCDLIRECRRAGVEVRGVAMTYDPKSSTILLLDPSIPIEL